MKIAVVTDSGCGLNKQETEAEGIYYLPLQIVDGDKSYLDGIDVSKKEVFQMIKEGKMMKTSQPPIGMIDELFTRLKEEGYEHVICIPLSSGLSSTSHTIVMCAKQVEMPITIIETYTTANVQMYLAKAAKRLVDEGVDLEEIVARLNDSVKHSNTMIIPDDLDHLKRGGRLTPLAAALGGMLKIKPILKLNESSEGKIDTYAKVRTMNKALISAVDAFIEDNKISEDYLLVCIHTESEYYEDMKKEYFGRFPELETSTGFIGPVISVHTGLGCLGIQYIKKV